MPIHQLTAGVAAAAVAGVAGLHGATPALAHDVHDYGSTTVALGWLHEPAYVGAGNAVQVIVKDAAGNPITPITDKDLQVEVSLDTEKMAAQPLVPTFDSDTGLGLRGEYELPLIPTAPGNYTFHVFGKVAGVAVDETVMASDRTFAQVGSASDAQFPVKVPAVSDLATKIDRVGSRVQNATDTAAKASTAVAVVQSSADDAKGAANRALAVGLVALVLGVLLGAIGLTVGLRGRRPRAAP